MLISLVVYQKKDVCVTPPTCSDDGVTPPSVLRVMSSLGCLVSLQCHHINRVIHPNHTLHWWMGDVVRGEGVREDVYLFVIAS